MTGSRIVDAVIAGGGIIGLSIGLELRRRGMSVIVLERGHAMRAASWAAGGMLAAHDPETPSAMLPLALRSLELYPEYLDRIEALAGGRVPLRTRRTLLQLSTTHAGADRRDGDAQLAEIQQWIPGFAFADRSDRFFWLEEESLDPRDLCSAVPTAFRASGGILLEEASVVEVESSDSGIAVTTAREGGNATRERIHAGNFVNCCGAWAGQLQFGGMPVTPVKGQMVTVALGADRLRCVLRTPDFYAIPRGDGRVTVGATVEHAGFDQSVEEEQIAALLRTAARLLPEIETAPMLESWAGLRPGTPDELPLLGAAEADHCWHATGHYRNGVLLAPATARVMAQIILGEPPEVNLESFSPSRFQASAATALDDSVSPAAQRDAPHPSTTSKSPRFAASHSASR